MGFRRAKGIRMRTKIPRERRHAYFLTYYANHREAITAKRRARYAAKVAAMPPKEPKPTTPLRQKKAMAPTGPRKSRAKAKPEAVECTKLSERPSAVSLRDRFAAWRKAQS